MALRQSKVLFYKAASVSLTALANAQDCCDAILQHFILLEKKGAWRGRIYRCDSYEKHSRAAHLSTL